MAIDQSDEITGTVSLLRSVDDMPSDHNDLLSKGNDLFDQLLEIEEGL